MKADEIFEALLSDIDRLDVTCDGLIFGDGEREIDRAATCHKLTLDVLERAKAAGAQMIVTHEPPFVDGNLPGAHIPVDMEKARRIEDSAVAVYRFHDHAHLAEPDYIHEGFIRATGLGIAERGEKIQLGVRRYALDALLTPRSLASLCRDRLGAKFARVCGAADFETSSLILALGGIGYHQIKLLCEPGTDLIVTGELNEVLECEHVKDICALHGPKAVVMLGHYTAEYMGMRLVAEKLNAIGVDTICIDSGEVWE